MAVSSTYQDLVSKFELRPITTEKQNQKALKVLDKLMCREKRSKDEHDYLIVLALPISEFEDRHYPFPRPSQGEMLTHLLEASEQSRTALVPTIFTGDSDVQSVLADQRELTRSEIKKTRCAFQRCP